MKKIKKFIFILLIILTLTACTVPPSPNGKAAIYGVVDEYSMYIGEVFDPLDGVIATDDNGFDATENLEYFGNVPVTNNKLIEAGNYLYEIILIINGIEVCKKEVHLTVLDYNPSLGDTVKPVINMSDKYTFEVGDEYSLLLKATDNVDGDISIRVEVSGQENLPIEGNKFTEAGTFELTLSVRDLSGNVATKKITIEVLEKLMYGELTRYDLPLAEYSHINDNTRLDKYNLVWADEFDYGGYPANDYWTPEIGNGNWGWGNGEKQYYTNSTKNAFVANGVLSINAVKESISGFSYSSARLISKNKVDFKYGYLEASIKLPGNGGAWPAFWLMPTKSVYGGWPNSGEIDIMEYQSNYENYYFGTAHTKNNHGSGITSGKKYAAGLETSFHKYALEWTPTKLNWYFDGKLYHSYSNPNRTENNENYWPFDQEFFFILNVAVGGTLGGEIDPNFGTATMEVDYVRVYQKNFTENDYTNPSIVDVNYSTTYNSINLAWNRATDNDAISHYEIILNGEHIASTRKLTYTILNLDRNTDYYVQVLAVDNSGNYSSCGERKIKTN